MVRDFWINVLALIGSSNHETPPPKFMATFTVDVYDGDILSTCTAAGETDEGEDGDGVTDFKISFFEVSFSAEEKKLFFALLL